ncbi:MAG: hypothetical protein IPM82_03580 [Saprospiraceae bacterium]|nr:hypothetical protein [Saprospiraceae bacterium]
MSGSITLTFTPNAGQCANPATTSISVTTPTTPAITGVPASICETEAAIPLPTPQGGFTGNWSGQGVTSNNFDPSGLSGSITLTFTPNAGQCANPATTTISVTTPTTPAITGVPASICETEAAIPLPTPQGGFAGNWSGQGVTNNSFDPSGLNGSITLTFTPNAGQCANPATTSITVVLSATPMLGTVTLCQDDGPYVLSNLNDPNFPAGTWSGPGVSGGNFDPAGQNGSVTLTFSPSANCVNTATTVVTVNLPVAPALGTATLCQNDSPLALSTLANPSYPNGTWSGPGVSGGNFDPTGQNGIVTLTFAPSANCTMPATTTVTVNATPSFTALMEPCDPATQTYTVSFTITGGTVPYTVDGTALAGSAFTSPTIPSGTSYSFVIDDANGCGPVTVSGTQDCSCTTDAGTMNFANAPLTFCYQSGGFSVPFNQDSLLDNNDVLQFVLHDSPGAMLGNIIATSNAPVIPTPPGLILGQTYYVSAIAGNDDGSGNVDFADPCFSVSQGIPVVFYLPTVQVGNDTSICASDCYDIPLQFTGAAPFYLGWDSLIQQYFRWKCIYCQSCHGSTLQFCPADFNITSGVVTIEICASVDTNFWGVSIVAVPPLTSPSAPVW